MKKIIALLSCVIILFGMICLHTACQNARDTTPETSGPEEAGDLVFTGSGSLPLPSLNEDIPYGQPFRFGGTVNSASPLVSVSAVIETEDGDAVMNEKVTFDVSENRTSVELIDITFPDSDDGSLTQKVCFEDLPAGTYVFNLQASSAEQEDVTLYSSRFRIVESEWNQLISNNLRNNYEYALAFFGSRDEFLFQYQWGEDRNITVKRKWTQTHLTTVTFPDGIDRKVHKKAAPYFNEAIDYLETVYVHVDGTYESGILKLRDLVASYDGIYNSRFVTGRSFVSHHAFGTAVDLNAVMDVCYTNLVNRDLIYEDVHDHLVYNGIQENDGIRYYDFTYDGNYPETFCDVPHTIVNYLLYELAFYRAGFSWGFYYPHTCDGMHFSVSEMDPDIHNTSEWSLRKVYEY